MAFSARTLMLALMGCVLSVATWAAQADKTVTLPAVEVVGSKEEDFVLSIDRIPGTRLWLRPVGKDTMLAAPRYHGRGLKAGDEIVSIDGRLLQEMAPGAGLREFHRFSPYALPSLQRDFMDIEVRGTGSKTLRKVRLVKTPSVEDVFVEKGPERK